MQQQRQQGQSLLELIIAMGLGLLLLSILMAGFQSAKITASYIDGLVQIQETIRTFYYLLEQDLQQPKVQVLNPATIPNSISTRFAKGTSAIFLKSTRENIVYFVSGKKPDYELHRKDLAESLHNQDAIANGISHLEIQYGILLNKRLQFVSAAAISNWKKIKLIKIILQLQSSHLVNGKGIMVKTVIFIVGIP